MTAPQRYVGNELNVFRTAALVPSSVLPVEDQVLEIPASRLGTGNVRLTGPYTGTEPADYDVEIVDTTVDDPVVTAVVAAGAGSGRISNIIAHAPAQTYTVELANDGIPTLNAGVDFEGVRIIARAAGATGNLLALSIDQDALVFTPQEFSLLEDLPVGAGGASSGLQGAAYDWDTKVLSADNIIPADAHRVSFGDDSTNVYLQYKQYVDGEWEYHFVPALKRAVPKGTIVKFVTGGRTVTVSNNSVIEETYTNMVTVYDLLNAIKTSSALLDVAGVVAYDRSPTGQAARELLLRTDAHVEPSTGTGSEFATGFVNTFANPNAATEIITATCYAVTAADHPLARVGAERWHLKGSVSGDLGEIVTGEPFTDPGGKFGLTIPRKLPDGYGIQRGRFTHTATTYVPRDENEKPPICPVALTLGTEAVDQTITLVWTQRPSGDCVCSGMSIPKLNPRCLGLFSTEGGESSMYQTDTIERLVSLYDWYADIVRQASGFQMDGSGVVRHFIVEPNETLSDGFTVESLQAIVERFEETLAELDPLADTSLRSAGTAEWDTSFTELQSDVDDLLNGTAGPLTLEGLAAESLSANQAVVWYNDGATNKVRKAVFGFSGSRYGFVDASYTVGQTVTVRLYGVVGGQSGLTIGAAYCARQTVPGTWSPISGNDCVVGQDSAGKGAAGTAISTTEIAFGTGLGGTGYSEILLSERYRSRLNVVLITAGISPLGKTDANTIESGDGCWRDEGGDYWTVVGSAKGAYAPCFNNTPYYASRLSEDGKKYYSTKEFGLQLNIKCPELLVYGDTITLQIGGAGWGATYQPKDTLSLSTIAAGPLQLAGGQNGNALIDFYVSGSLTGALPNYTYDPDSPAPYYEAGLLQFLYTPGGIPNKKGDRWTFSVEGGHYRWRKDGGAWSVGPYPSIGTDPAAFDSGLLIAFIPGASPSFQAGDQYSFIALQPWAVSNVRTPDASVWAWSGSAPTLDGDAGSVVSVPGCVIARHTIPQGATITLRGGVSAANEWAEVLTWRPDVIAAEFATAREARYLRIEMTAATGGSIGWAWAGVMLTTELSADIDLRDSYKIESGTDLDDGGKYFAQGTSGAVRFEKAALTESDASGLKALIRWAKTHNDEPCAFIPNIKRPDEAYLVQVAVDELTWEESSNYNADPAARARRYNIDIPLSPVWRV